MLTQWMFWRLLQRSLAAGVCMHALHGREITVGLDRWLFGVEIRVLF